MFDTRYPSILDQFLINALGIKGVIPVFGPSVRQLRSYYKWVYTSLKCHTSPPPNPSGARERERDVWLFRLSLRNRTAGRRGRQNTCVWQTWQGNHSRATGIFVVGRGHERQDRTRNVSGTQGSRDLHFTPMFSGPLQKDLFKGKWSLAKSCFKKNYCHACHTRFAVFFPLPSSCVSSLMLDEVRSP